MSHAIPNLLNAAIVLAQIFAVGSCFLALPHVEGGWQCFGLAVVFGIVMNSVYASIHEAEHAMLFSNRRLNDGIGVALALLFPAPFHLIRQGHLGHHLRNRSDDEAFDLYFEGDSKLWRTVVFYGILTGFYYVIVVLSNAVFLLLPWQRAGRGFRIDQPTVAFMESLNGNYRWHIRLEAAAAIVLHTGAVWLLGVPVLKYAAMYAGFGFMWSAMQYVHHYGTERHVTRGAKNLWVWQPLDLLWLNHNWHLTHHMHPSVPWIHLPGVAANQDPPDGWLVAAYLKMWRGPRRATERVPNPNAGRTLP